MQKIPPTIHKGRYSVDKMQLTAPESVFWPRISGDILMPCLDLNGLLRYESLLIQVNIFRV